MRSIPLVLALAAALAAGGAWAHNEHASHGAAAMTPAVVKSGNAKVTVPDVSLVDQNGKAHALKGGVVGDRIVVVDFIYTTCTTVCPVISQTFADVQAIMAHRCQACHSASPTDTAYKVPPKGIAFDTADQIQRMAPQIERMVVLTQAMPLANKTGRLGCGSLNSNVAS